VPAALNKPLRQVDAQDFASGKRNALAYKLGVLCNIPGRCAKALEALGLWRPGEDQVELERQVRGASWKGNGTDPHTSDAGWHTAFFESGYADGDDVRCEDAPDADVIAEHSRHLFDLLSASEDEG
jgi:hypothetical protein